MLTTANLVVILAFAVCTVLAQPEMVVFTTTIMTAAHPQFTNPARSLPNGFVVNGNEGAELKLVPGKKYRLVANQPCTFPLYLSTSSDGTSPISLSALPIGAQRGVFAFSKAGVAITDYNTVCAGAYIDYTPVAADIGQTFYYQTTVAKGFGWKVSIVGTTTFAANVALMTAAHPQFNNPLRISSGYTINGVEGAALTLSVGQTYRFKVNNPCSHPMYISMDQNGGGVDFNAIDTTVPLSPHGITLRDANGNAIANQNGAGYLTMCGGNILEIKPQAADIGMTLYYQCAYHIGMGWQIKIVQQTFCEKYVNALGQSLFMDAVIGAIIGNIVADPLLLPFFNADYASLTSPACCTVNFLNTTSEFLRLKKELTAFFGAFLGCNEVGFPVYTGPKDMKALHALMPISTAEFNRFNQIVRSTVLGLGVNATDYAPLGAFLDSTKVQICNSGDCRTSICDRYTDALKTVVGNNVGLLTFVVTQTFGKLVASTAPTKKYFDGTRPAGSTNFTDSTNGAQLNTLVNHLVQFFGMKGVLSCTDPGFPAYQGIADMAKVHKAMAIPATDFDFFNQALISVLAAAGVTTEDQTAVLAVLESTRSAIVAPAPGPGPQPPGPQPPAVNTINYTFIVAAKNSSHPFNGRGFSQGFYADKAVTLMYGNQYRFNYAGSCSHPLYLTTDAVGGGSGEISASVSAPDYTLVCGPGGSFVVDVNDLFCQQVNAQNLYYNCRVHGSMGGPVTVTGCPASKGTTFCEIYANTLNVSHLALIQTVVNATIPKLVAAGSPVLKYFDGTYPPGSVNYLTNPAALDSLDALLYAFFGQAFGCTDPTFPKYTGRTMKATHAMMGINQAEFDFFNKQIIDVLKSAGVTVPDQALALSVLAGTKADIVGAFCPRYASALKITQQALVSTVVDGAVGKLVAAASVNKKYFDGTRPSGSVNFLDAANAAKLTTLKGKLVAFFGSALGCNEAGYPVYTGTPETFAAVHYPMGISNAEFDDFNKQVLDVMIGAGVTADDAAAVKLVLDGTRGAITGSFCQRYAVTLGVSQLDLVKTVVNATVLKLVAPGSINLKYFDGTKPKNSVNFLTNTAAFGTLFDHLVQFFGQQGVLSCNDPTYPKYQGNTDMAAVHRAMGISNAEFDDFNKQLLSVLNGAGVTLDDQKVVQAILETTRTGIVVPPVTFCSKYASALQISQVALVSTVVDGTVTKLVAADSINKKYFDGTKPSGSTNFLLGGAPLTNLKASLVAFFGQDGVLSCNEAGYPAYTGRTMKAVHANMGISKTENDAFTAALMATLKDAGVTDTADLQSVTTVLDSVRMDIESPATPTGITSLMPWQIGVIAAVGIAVIVAIVVTIVCCIKRGKGENSNYVAF